MAVVFVAWLLFVVAVVGWLFYKLFPRETGVLKTLPSNRLRVKFVEIPAPANTAEGLFRKLSGALDVEGYGKKVEDALVELNVALADPQVAKQFLEVEGALILLVKCVGTNGFQLSNRRRTAQHYANLEAALNCLATLTKAEAGLAALIKVNEGLYDVYVAVSYAKTASRTTALSLLTSAVQHSEQGYKDVLTSAVDYMYIPGDEEYLFAHMLHPLLSSTEPVDTAYATAVLKFIEKLLVAPCAPQQTKMIRHHIKAIDLTSKLTESLKSNAELSAPLNDLLAAISGDDLSPDFHTVPFEKTTCYSHQFASRTRWFTRTLNCLFNTLPATLPLGQGALQKFTDEFRRKSEDRMNQLKVLKRSGDFTPEEISKFNREMSALTLGVGVDFFDHMKECGMFEETRAFIERAESIENWNHEELLQAGRNVWTCFGLQMIIYQQNVTMSDAYLGYSLLYPYTDNYLDDDSISGADKKIFQDLFTRRLAGENVEARSEAEQKIWNCVTLIENRFNRKEFPNAFNSLIAINEAQTKSLQQHSKNVPPEELIMEISMEKGGTSVLADGYLVNGDMTEEEALFAFGLGVALQLVDDLQDTSRDIAVHQHTLFTLPYMKQQPADARACRLIQLMQVMVDPANYANLDDGGNKLRFAMLKMTNTIAIKAVAKYCYLFTEPFVEEVAQCSPIPLTNLSRVNNMARMLQMVRSDQI
eukprot:TRINITY_DN5184_c0_g2_i1.p1 TRINITY_DN5184_c0_g2~~TRINITY_DN5184_c0_g2_i1.p1  ORF type:complete len:703 (-),score=121.93 TRINITY_DN5184_c0_g2_i1:156-2264(-)